MSQLLYDPSGNLTRLARGASAPDGSYKGGMVYSYDEADRLTSVVNLDANTGANRNKEEFLYDGLNRVVVSRVSSWDSTANAWTAQSEKRRVYDGLSVVQERDASNAVTHNLTRGAEMGGGIGGLLARQSATRADYYHYDGRE